MLALTPAEVAAFTGLNEKAVRKDVERGVVNATTPPRFNEPELVYFCARSRFQFQLATRDRRRLYALILDAMTRNVPRLDLGRGWWLELASIANDLQRQLTAFLHWKETLVVSASILGGEPVFPGSRLAVRHIGGLILSGAPQSEIQEDYPYLTEQDLEFARLYATAYPRRGRPRGQGTVSLGTQRQRDHGTPLQLRGVSVPEGPQP